MAKDPFANLPQIEQHDDPEPGSGVSPDHASANEDVTEGAPPRTLIKTLTKWSVPIMGLAIGVWLFLPEDQTAMRAAAPAPVSVDTEKQATDTAGMVDELKVAAAKKPITAPVMPGSTLVQPNSAPQTAPSGTPVAASTNTAPGGTNTYRPPMPPGYASGQAAGTAPMPTGGIDEKQQAAYQAYLDRQQEIRASAIEVSKVRVAGEAGKTAAAVPQALAGLQSDLAADDERTRAARTQQEMQERMIAAMAPKEQPKSKGANEEFLLANAAAANNSPNLARQMAPLATTVVNEGHVIRTALLTNVSSDLPGRIIARVTSDVYDSKQRHVVIPKGSQLIGVYSSGVVVGQERLLMAMNRLILPNGTWVSLSGAGAADMMGMSGVKADVNNHFMKMFGSSLVLGATSLLLPRSDTTISTVPGVGSNGGSGTAGSVFATSLNDVVKTLLERNKQIPPTLSLQAGEEFIFLVAQDIAMVPYRP